MKKAKTAKQLFREGLKKARLRLTAIRGHYVTPEELGADVGVSGQTIRNYESGVSEPNFEMVEKLAAVLGVILAWPPFGEKPTAGVVELETIEEGTLPVVTPPKKKSPRKKIQGGRSR